MKKIITTAMLLVAVMSFAQMETTKHKVMAGADFSMGSNAPIYEMIGLPGWSYDAKAQFMNFTVPGVNYQFESKPNDMFKLYLHADAGYMMSKWTYDGDAPANGDVFASAMYLMADPMAKAYLPNNLFVKLGLPFNYISMTPQWEDADAESRQKLDMWANFGFDNRDIEMRMLTPWDKFEKGMAFYGVFEMGIMESWEGNDTEDLPMFFGVKGCYAHLMENMMIKPYLSFMTQLNEDAAEDKDTELVIGAMFAKDFTEQFNLEADLNLNILDTEYSTWDEAANEALARLWKMNISARGNFYVMPELNIFADLGLSMDMSREDTDMGIAYGLGAVYTMDLLK